MLHQLFSLAEIKAGLEDAHPDVVLAYLERMRHAPKALQRLSDLAAQEEGCWRTLNLTQVRAASFLAQLLAEACRKTGWVARSILRMEEALVEVDKIGAKLQQIMGGAAAMVGVRAVELTWTEPMGRLEEAHTEILRVLHHDLVKAKKAKARRLTTRRENKLLRQIERALNTLLDLNRTVVRQIDKVHSMVHRLDLYNQPPDLDEEEVGEDSQQANHALPSIDKELIDIAQYFADSIDKLVTRLNAGDDDAIVLITFCRQELKNRLNMPVAFNHSRFSGVLNVRTKADLTEVVSITMPHQGVGWFPPRNFQVHIFSLPSLEDVNNVCQIVNEGVMHRGWTVRTLNALNTARLLDEKIVSIRDMLPRLLGSDVMFAHGEVHKPAAFDALEELRKHLEGIMGNGLVTFLEAWSLADQVQGVVVTSRKPQLWPTLRLKMVKLRSAVLLTRKAKVLLLEQAIL